MDANGDGVVTKEELRTLLKGLGEEVTDEVVDEMIAIADENGDGKVDFEEFVKASSAEWTKKKNNYQLRYRTCYAKKDMIQWVIVSDFIIYI